MRLKFDCSGRRWRLLVEAAAGEAVALLVRYKCSSGCRMAEKKLEKSSILWACTLVPKAFVMRLDWSHHNHPLDHHSTPPSKEEEEL
jgi:hypothetical protein